MGFSNEMSPADLGAIVGNNDGFGGGNGAWWLIILFLFAFCGNGWGNGGYGTRGGVSENYTLISDMGQIERKIDGVYSGICDSTYALNNAITGGFASAQSTMTQGFAGLNTGMVQQGYESRLATNQIGSQMAQCCCDLRQQISDVNYNMAQNTNNLQSAVQTGFCQTNFNNQNNTRDIIDSQNAGTQAILKAIQDNKVEALKDRIAEQNQMINSLQLSASQSAQNEYLISALRPTPVPSFPASNLYGFCGCNNSCGC
ncbi:MAG: hypothetical protein KBT03_12870 [Bacteroidales bacterium]|nr:hypothetical protein [Candidatus Scybalousia scybalohippi]